jgi:hypothetical protein
MSGMRRSLVCIVLTLVALAAGGCGGDGDAPTRAQFVAQTDKLCQATNRRTRTLNLKLRRAAAGARTDRDLLRRLAPILDAGYDRVRENAEAFSAVKPPDADAAQIARLRRLYDRQAQFLRRLAAAARRGEVSRFESLTAEQQDVVTRARRLSRAYGFKQCGSTRSDPA